MTTAEKIAVMQAYEDGKAIQVSPIGFAMWNDKSMPPLWNWAEYDYRIKPEEKKPTYRPYKDTAEMIADYDEHFNMLKLPPHVMPLIWVQRKNAAYPIRHLITAFRSTSVFTGTGQSIGLKEIFAAYTYLDGTPCGKLVE